MKSGGIAVCVFSGTLACFSAVAATAPQTTSKIEPVTEPEMVEIFAGQFSTIGWDRGTFELTLSRGGAIRLTFNRQHDSPLSALSLSTADWTLDLAGYIPPLSWAIGHRILVKDPFQDDSGKLRSMGLLIPHLALADAISGRRQCRVLELTIEDGAVVGSDTYDDQD